MSIESCAFKNEIHPIKVETENGTELFESFSSRYNLYVEQVVVPTLGRDAVLARAHRVGPGVDRVVQLGRPTNVAAHPVDHRSGDLVAVGNGRFLPRHHGRLAGPASGALRP